MLSPVLLRDPVSLRPTTDPNELVRVLRERHGLAVRLTEDSHRWMGGVERREGWQSTWVRPRPSLVGIAAGTTFALELDDEKTPPGAAAVVRALQLWGIGERRIEGYGQVGLFNVDATGRLVPFNRDRERPTLLPITAEPGVLALASSVERVAWVRWIERNATRVARTKPEKVISGLSPKPAADWVDALPTNSQLGALRASLAHLDRPGGAATIKNWLEHTREIDNRRKGWPHGALEGLAVLFDEEHRAEVWKLLGYESSDRILIDRDAVPPDDLWPFAIRTLLVAVIRAEQRRRAGSRGRRG